MTTCPFTEKHTMSFFAVFILSESYRFIGVSQCLAYPTVQLLLAFRSVGCQPPRNFKIVMARCLD